MKIFELYRLGWERKILKELQTGDIEQDLDQTARGIGAATSARQGDMTGMDPTMDPAMGTGQMGMDGMGMGGMGMGGDPMGGMPQAAAQPGLDPDMSMTAGDGLEGQEELETKKIDSAILTQVQGMPYVEKFDHGDSKVSPEKILTMEIDELAQLRNAALNTLNVKRLQDKVGLYADPEMDWYEALRDFVDKVLDLKKRADKPVQKKRQGKTAKWEEKSKSKNSKSKEYRKPPRPKGA